MEEKKQRNTSVIRFWAVFASAFVAIAIFFVFFINAEARQEVKRLDKSLFESSLQTSRLLEREIQLEKIHGLSFRPDKIRRLLESSLTGNRIVEVVCDPYLTPVVATDTSFLLRKYSDKDKRVIHVFPDTIFRIKATLAVDSADSRYSALFKFAGGEGHAICRLIGNTNYFLIAAIPPKTFRMVWMRNVIFFIIFAVIILLILGTILFVAHRNRRVENAESETHYRNVLTALTEAFGIVIEVNIESGVCKILKTQPDSANGIIQLLEQIHSYNKLMAVLTHSLVFPEDSYLFDDVRSLDHVKESFARVSKFDFVYRLTNSNGETHYMQSFYVRPSKQRPEFVIGFKDVDDAMKGEMEKRKLATAQSETLKLALNKAKSADKAKSMFLFNMSHDIRTPMNAVLGFDTLAQQYMCELGLPPEQTEKLARCLNNIQLSGKQLLELINSVLNMARIESGEVKLEEAPTPFAELAGNVSVTFEESAREKKILMLVSRSISHKYIVCDRVKMQQVILNVVSNAIKYTPSAGTVKVRFEETKHEQSGWCYIVTTVEDNGIGISKEFLPHMFETFEREHSAASNGIMGTGLGLSIVKKYLDLMQGTIQVTSELGKGTKIVMRTPHRISAENEIPENNPVVLGSSEQLRGRRILLVEDNDMNREIASQMLKTFGLVVECVRDGFECLDKIEKEPAKSFDLVLMDVQMPRMDGYETTRTIRKLSDPEKAQIPIFALTANAFSDDEKKSMESGMNGHISKPVDFTKFRELLGKVFN